MPASHAAFEMFFSREYQPVVRAMFVMTGDRAGAEDLAQEAFARCFHRWARVSAYERPDAWVRRVAINLAIGARRRKSADIPSQVEPGAAADRLDLHRAILTLPRMQRAAVVLHYLEDRPVGECATILGCAEATARVHLHRARTRLAELLGEEVGDADR